ncbi:MAG TPA: ankyrin repeat domain-containing protein [Dinghuibacter sp.]|uniref:ankyrin repeat domain-containing protein n=1 Tax=Dinghuibacter sp. TaxID=2024697 RepID=UPI002D12D2BA|nr:ankyrin repeat domain-containing protein [Dinghuibacter sp.]HTJ10372.1 ankyrin repeat domain-containing protein [Dinghuibacter sp.]
MKWLAYLTFVLITGLAHGQTGDATLMARIIRSGDAAQLEARLKKGADPNAALDGYTPLMLAALSGTPEEMTILLHHGARVNDVNPDSLTALWFAIPSVKKASVLLDHGANPNLYSKEGFTPLVKLAHFAGSLPLLRLMIAHGADPRHAAGDNTLMYNAAATGDTALVGALIGLGLPVDDTAYDGDYPINQCVYYSDFGVLTLLVEHGARVNVGLPRGFLPNTVGITPLMTAAVSNDLRACEYLLEHGADVNARNATGYTPLMFAQMSNTDNPGVTKTLIARGARIRDKARDGMDALTLAQVKGNTESVQLLKH